MAEHLFAIGDSVDPSFQAGVILKASSFPSVQAISIQTDGKILLGGDFTSVGAAERNQLARLDANGTLNTQIKGNMEFDLWLRSL